MPVLFDLKRQEPVQVSPGEVASLLQGGDYAFPGEHVNLVNRQGEARSFSSADPFIFEALGGGYHVEEPEERQARITRETYGNSPIAATLAGAARTLSFGASDVIAPALGIASKEQLSGWKEANPEYNTLGEVGAGIGSLLIPGAAVGRGVGYLTRSLGLGAAAERAYGGATAAVRGVESLGAKAGKEAAEFLLPRAEQALAPLPGSKLLAKSLAKGADFATQGVVEGGLFGAGQLVSEHALGDTELSAERIMSQVGASALLSAAAGGALGGVVGMSSPAVRAASKRLGELFDSVPKDKQGWSEKAGELARDSALKSVSAMTSTLRKLRKQGLLDIAPEAMFNIEHPDGKTILRSFANAQETSKRLDETVDFIGKDIGATVKNLDRSGMRTGVSASDIADQIRSKVIRPLSKYATLTDVEGRLLSFAQKLDALGDKEVSFLWLHRQKNKFTKAYSSIDPSEIQEAFREGERVVNQAMENSMAKAMSAEDFAKFKDLKNKYWSLRTLQKETRNRVDTLDANRFFSLGDRVNSAAALAGGIGGGLYGDEPADRILGSAAGSLALGLGSRFARTRSASALAILLHKASRMLAVEKATQAAAAAEKSAVNDVANSILGLSGKTAGKPKALGFTAYDLAPSAGRDIVPPSSPTADVVDDFADDIIDRKFLQPNALAVRGETGLDIPFPEPEIVSPRGRITAGLPEIDEFIPYAEYEDVVEPRAFMGSGRSPRSTTIPLDSDGLPKVNSETKKYAGEQIRALQRFSETPGASASVSDQIKEQLGDVAPQIADAMAKKVNSVLSFFASEFAPPQEDTYLIPKATDSSWLPTTQQASDFLRYQQAIQDPISVLSRVGGGLVDQKSVELIREVYPLLYKEIVSQVLERLAKSDSSVSYNKRISLGALLGINMADPTMNPNFVRGMQEAASFQSQASAGQKPPATVTDDDLRMSGLDQLSGLSMGLETQSQRVEANRP